MSEDKPDYVSDALEMIGAGYAAVEIEKPRTSIERRDGQMKEVSKPAFVKISTAFKSELADISGDALKVWLFICLSINRNTGKANPGLRTIAAGVNLAVNTVQKALRELEDHNLLLVDRDTRHYNLYESPEFVSANRADPTVSNGDTVAQTVSNSAQTVSNLDPTVSPSVILNQINQNKPDLVDFELSKLPAMSIRQAVHEYFRLNTNWDTKYNRQWMEWAVEQGITAEQIKTAAETWRSDKAFNWQVPSLKGIFEKWQMLMDAQPEQSPVERRIKNLERDL